MNIRSAAAWEPLVGYSRAVRVGNFVFEASPPATSMLEVSKLIDPRMLVEIEADAIVDNDSR